MGDAGHGEDRGTDRGGRPAAARRAALRVPAVVLAGALAACATPEPVPPAPATPPPRTVPAAAGTCPTPAFPELANRSEATGLTRVTGEVQPDGTVRSVVVVRSAGSTRAHKALDRAAADALSRCRFPAAPGTSPATTTVDYRWTLD